MKKTLSPAQIKQLLNTLQTRFEQHMNRHTGLTWTAVQAKLEKNPEKLWSLHEMEQTGGEPDVVAYDLPTGKVGKADEFVFFDCSAESPQGRRSVCYDREALDGRQANKPADSALDMATAMGIELLTEAEYRALQGLGDPTSTAGGFDRKTSSWIKTPDEIRKHGGALFCDRRYHTVFVYHNGAESYYATRGFRGSLRI